MFTYLPTMILAGRLRYHRLYCLATDAVISMATVFTILSTLQWWIPAGIAVLFASIFAAIGYRSYFLPTTRQHVERIRVARNAPMISLLLIVKDKHGFNEEVPLSAKVVNGSVYHLYVLYIYMHIGRSLMQFVRKRQSEKKS